MNRLNKIKSFLADENGAETVEWVVVAAGIAAVAIAVFGSSGTLKAALVTLVGKITTAIGLLTV